jgi:K(+)-stimulated pyrophosphate-energized sodium pump
MADIYQLGIVIAVLTLLYAGYLYIKIKKAPTGDKKMQDISNAIKEGAVAFLKREYKILGIFVAVIAVVILFALDNKTTAANEGVAIAISFIFGAVCSVLAGVIGMKTATSANVRTTEAAKKGLNSALKVAFSSGSIMGLSVVSLGILGICLLMFSFANLFMYELSFIVKVISGFGLGASSIALFARVGGGIYTKAADVGADLVGKVEKGIPEDDPRNPGVIADNVGDNVGDVAGMGADLFESYVGSIIAAMTLGLVFGTNAVILPIAIALVGIVSSLFGGFFVRMSKKTKNVEGSLKYGLLVSSLAMAILSYFVIRSVYGEGFIGVYTATIIGLIVGAGIGLITEYFTSANYSPTKKVAAESKTGAATVIISGLSLGYISTIIPILLICIGIYVSYAVAGIYGIAIAAVGMLSTLGYSLSTDAYGPVADNAGGIAEMAGLPKKVRAVTDELDAAGNTTAAIGKGFAIGSAALTALALFAAYMATTGLTTIDIAKPTVIIGLLLGGLLPFVFSAITMNAVGKAASAIIDEVRRQFREIKGLMAGKAKPHYSKCVDIATKASLQEMILPGAIAIVAPILVGVTLGAEAVGGLLAGALVTGVLLAISMANSGGSWDNAKKYIEQGNFGGKGSDAHKASVVGDTVGDPFKDTSGPSLNILIKLMSIVALVFGALFVL